LCRDCFNKIPLASNNTCFFCEEITGQGRICINCKKEKYLDRVISTSEYKNPLIRDLIRAFKYHYVQELANPLSQLLIKVFENNSNISNISGASGILVVPIPLFKHRLHYRGFNQAELIAQEIAKHFKLPIEINTLKRKTSRAPSARRRRTESGEAKGGREEASR